MAGYLARDLSSHRFLRTPRWPALAARLPLTAAAALLMTVPLAADEFRIETQVFVGKATEPASTNLTLFQDGVAYDFLTDPPEVTVIKPSVADGEARIVLLDQTRRVRTELETGQLSRFLASLEAWAAEQSDPLLKFSAQPDFQEKWDPKAGELRLDSRPLRYRLLTDSARSPEAMQQYRQFADWTSRLGALMQPGTVPPFARLQVNAALARRSVLPKEVQLTIAARAPYRNRDIRVRSEHKTGWSLSRDDRKRIESAGDDLVTFRQVDLQTYRKGR